MKTKLSKNFLANELGCKPCQIRRIHQYRFSRFESLYIVERPYGYSDEQKVCLTSVFLRYGSILKFDFILKDVPQIIYDHLLDEVSDFISIIRADFNKVPLHKLYKVESSGFRK